jgi:hypothetical protein
MDTSSRDNFYERMLGRNHATADGQDDNPISSRRALQEKNGALAIELSRSPWDQIILSSKNRLDPALNYRPSLSGIDPTGPMGLTRPLADNRLGALRPEAVRAKQLQEDQLRRFQAILNGTEDLRSTAAARDSTLTANPWGNSAPALPLAPGQASPLAKPQGGINPLLAPPGAPVAPMPSSLVPAPDNPLPTRNPPPKPVFSPPPHAF